MSQDNDDNQGGGPPTPESHAGGQRPPSTGQPAGGEGHGTGVDEPGRASEEENREEREDEEPDESLAPDSVDHVQGALEAVLLAHDSPLDRDTLAEAFEEVAPEVMERAIERLKLEYSGRARGIHLEEVAGGLQFRTNPAYHPNLEKLVEANPVSLSRAALETLAIVAYRQPLTRAEVEEIRGVNSSGVLRTLEQCELIRVVGRLDDLGRPHIYGTTDRFLEFFGLDDLTDLPTLSEGEHDALEKLYEEELEKFDEEFDGEEDSSSESEESDGPQESDPEA